MIAAVLAVGVIVSASPPSHAAKPLGPVRPSSRPFMEWTGDGFTPVPVEPTAPEFAWDIPELIEDVPVYGGMESEGVPVRAHAVRSKMKLEPLMNYVAQSFRRADLYIPPFEKQFHLQGAVSITALDDERMVSYTAIFQENPDGTTTVILGEANLAQRKPQTGEEIVPVMPGARAKLHSSTEGAATLSYEIDGTREDVESYYRSVMPEFGFAETGDGVFEGNGSVVEIHARPVAKNQATVVVLRHDLGPLPPPLEPGVH